HDKRTTEHLGDVQPIAMGTANPVAMLLRLQRTAGNAAVASVLGGPERGDSMPLALVRGRQPSAVVQRDGPKPAQPGGASPGVAYKGQLFTENPAQMRALIERLVGEHGQDDAETVLYAFLRMGTEEKIAL